MKSIWFTQMGNSWPIGIVLVLGPYGDKAYIGTGFGISQEQDEQHVARTGASFPLEIAQLLLGMV